VLAPHKFSILGVLIVPCLFLSIILSGCSPFYVLRAAYEEGKILWRREPIAQFLEKPDINQETQEKLKLVLAVREYARDVLKFNVGGSYASYSYVDRPDLTFILTAAPKTELIPYTWWFLIVGRVPYMGYFSKADAEEAAAELRAEGYDTNIRTSAAFSTLGWFDDPLLSHLLRYDKVTLADVVFHELFHNTLYVKGAGNFNESSANFIGHRAAIDFFRDRFGENSAEQPSRHGARSWNFPSSSKNSASRSANFTAKRFRSKTSYGCARAFSTAAKKNGRNGSLGARRIGSAASPSSRSTTRC